MAAPDDYWERAQSGMRRIGVLMGYAESDLETEARLAAFRQRLERRGWAEGRNVQIEARFAGRSSDRYQLLAKELISLEPDVIVAHTTMAAAALQREQAGMLAVRDRSGPSPCECASSRDEERATPNE
jgi:DNA-binding LacI/PurR family transcriptional regulator